MSNMLNKAKMHKSHIYLLNVASMCHAEDSYYYLYEYILKCISPLMFCIRNRNLF